MLNMIVGPDPKDPTCSDIAVPDYEAALDGDLRGLRIGLPSTYFLEAADAPVIAAVEQAAEVLRGRGATLIRMTLPLMDAVSAYVAIISRVEAATIHATWMRERAGEYGRHLSGRLYPGYAIPGTYYVEALSRRGPILKEFSRLVFSQVDVLLTPTIPTRPARKNGSWRFPSTPGPSTISACRRSASIAGSIPPGCRSACRSPGGPSPRRACSRPRTRISVTPTGIDAGRVP
jgi:Asp-tRNA(Asn)/Glu-tRNA(Gln) amidotransferase A subunit family amidase